MSDITALNSPGYRAHRCSDQLQQWGCHYLLWASRERIRLQRRLWTWRLPTKVTSSKLRVGRPFPKQVAAAYLWPGLNHLMWLSFGTGRWSRGIGTRPKHIPQEPRSCCNPKGSISVVVAGETHVLEAGDAGSIPGDVEHSYCAVGEELARFLPCSLRAGRWVRAPAGGNRFCRPPAFRGHYRLGRELR